MLYLNNVVQGIDEQCHGTVGFHGVAIESDDCTLAVAKVIHHCLEHQEASAKAAHLRNDNRITVLDWLYQSFDALLRDAAHGEVVLDEVVVFDTIGLTPRNKGRALLLEGGGVVVEGEVEVVHGKLGPTRPVKGG